MEEERKRKHKVFLTDQIKKTAAAISTCGKTEVQYIRTRCFSSVASQQVTQFKQT
jgi:transposase-like protein